jgi:acetyl-CoA synthetase
LFTLFGPDAIQYRLNNSSSKVLITNEENLEKLDGIKDSLPHLEEIILVTENENHQTKIGNIKIHSFWKLM